jgi:glutathione S-transferase
VSIEQSSISGENMKLHYSTASPYVRKVMVVAIETGQIDRIETSTRQLTPINPSTEVSSDNPIGKVPCLVTDDGMALYDSRVICEYLDSLHNGTRMFPASGDARWKAIRRQALGDGILDAGVTTRYETFLRPEALRWSDWIDGQKRKMNGALDAAEAEAASFGDSVDIGTITIACALGYMDFRYGNDNWRASRPKLAAWFEQFSKRPSLAQTMPQ